MFLEIHWGNAHVVVCPKCKADRAHRSHRRDFWENVAGLLFIYPYRCHACEHRFLRFRYADGPFPAVASGAERDVRATRRSIHWRRKRREILLYVLGFLVFLAFLYYITRQRESSSEGSRIRKRTPENRYSFCRAEFPTDFPNSNILNIKLQHDRYSVSSNEEMLKEYPLTVV
jgi:hypothetical protein